MRKNEFVNKQEIFEDLILDQLLYLELTESISWKIVTLEELFLEDAGKKSKRPNVILRACPLYFESLQNHPNLIEKLKEWITRKMETPLESIGKDAPFKGGGPIDQIISKLRHAHINQDVSLVYKMYGNPIHIDLYGLFSHKELGTGNSTQIKAQQRMAKQFLNQEPKFSTVTNK